MEEALRGLEGRKIDVSFGSSAGVRGSVRGVENGILTLEDEDGKRVYIAVEKIAFFVEVRDSEPKAGFLNNIG